jgi:hypothetical protein
MPLQAPIISQLRPNIGISCSRTAGIEDETASCVLKRAGGAASSSQFNSWIGSRSNLLTRFKSLRIIRPSDLSSARTTPRTCAVQPLNNVGRGSSFRRRLGQNLIVVLFCISYAYYAQLHKFPMHERGWGGARSITEFLLKHAIPRTCHVFLFCSYADSHGYQVCSSCKCVVAPAQSSFSRQLHQLPALIKCDPASAFSKCLAREV